MQFQQSLFFNCKNTWLPSCQHSSFENLQLALPEEMLTFNKLEFYHICFFTDLLKTTLADARPKQEKENFLFKNAQLQKLSLIRRLWGCGFL